MRISWKRINDRSWISKGLKNQYQIPNTILDSTKHHYVIATLQILSNTKYIGICEEDVSMKLRRHTMKTLFQDIKSSSYNMWKHWGAIINPNKKNRRCHENILLCDGKFSTDNKHITDSMNTYFCKTGSHLQQLMLNCGTEYNRYLPNRVNNTFFLTPVNEDESLNEIKMLNPRKSSGAHNIGARLVQLCPAVFAENWTKIYNNAMSKREYPA